MDGSFTSLHHHRNDRDGFCHVDVSKRGKTPRESKNNRGIREFRWALDIEHTVESRCNAHACNENLFIVF